MFPLILTVLDRDHNGWYCLVAEFLGCSPLYEQSFIGILLGGTTIPIKELSHKVEHPKLSPEP